MPTCRLCSRSQLVNTTKTHLLMPRSKPPMHVNKNNVRWEQCSAKKILPSHDRRGLGSNIGTVSGAQPVSHGRKARLTIHATHLPCPPGTFKTNFRSNSK